MMLKGKHCRDTGWICLCCLILFVGMPMQAASISNATVGDSLLADTLNPLLSVPSQPIPDKLPVEHTFLHLFDELPQDSVMFLRQESRFSRLSPFWQISIPVTLTGVAAWGLSESGGMAKFRHKLRREFMKISGQKKIRIDDYLQYAPFGSFLWGGILPGVPHRHILRDRLLLGTTSYVLMGGLVNGIKYSVGELRPDESARNSFPSGHTATAVMGAELVRTEYGNVAGTGAYVVAFSVGVLRMYNNRHWFNDVLGGAAVGFTSVRLALWLLPWEQRLLGLRNKKTTSRCLRGRAATSPVLLPASGAAPYGLTLLWCF